VKLFDRGDLKPLAIVLTVGALVRTIVIIGSSGILAPDSHVYILSARSMLSEKPFWHDVYKTPGYPTFLAAFMTLGETPETGSLIIAAQHLLGLIAVAVFFVIGKQVFGRTVAFWSSLLFSLHTLLLFYETSVMSEVLFVFLLGLLLLQSLRLLSNPTPGTALLVGVLGAMATLTRPIAQGFVVCIVVVMFGAALLRDRDHLRRAIGAALIIGVTFAAAVLPWTYVNSRTYGFWGISLGHGFGLFIRVFEIDRLDPVPDTRYPDVRRALERARARNRNSYHVKLALRAAYRYSSRDIEQRLFGLASETVRAQPGTFAVNSFRNWGRHLLLERADIEFCPTEGGHYVCTRKTVGRSMPMFPNVPPQGRRGLREALARWFMVGYTRTRVLVPLAALGIGLCLFSRAGRTAPVVLLALTIVYFTGLPAMLQWAEERSRLPIDPLLFMFAVSSVASFIFHFSSSTPPPRRPSPDSTADRRACSAPGERG
jgi:4-amino-4-deoxy-L-arabinose transferase-like glycosyltransferase